MHQGEKKKKKRKHYALGSSQAAHFVSVTSLSTMQTLQGHVPGALLGALSPAAPQLKPPNEFIGAAGAEAGRGSSQEAHFVFAGSLSTIQTLHVHVPGAFVGALSPAADQLKPPVVGAAGFGGSDIAVGAVMVVPLWTFIPAASPLKPVDAGFAPKTNANVGSEDESATKAAPRSLT